MVRIVATALFTLFLSACSSASDWAVVPAFLNSGASPGAAHYSFDWQLSGERQVAPLQVFDNGKKTWLQFMPGQPVPAIFHRTRDGERPLSYIRQGDYLIIDGVWPELSFRGGLLQAYALQHPNHVPTEVADVFPVMSAAHEGHDDGADIDAESEKVMAPEPIITEPSAVTLDGLMRPDQGDDDVRDLTRASFDAIDRVSLSDQSVPVTSVDHESQASYVLTLQDQNLRKALYRWAKQGNWTFSPEHWAVDVDIPIAGEAVFEGPFPQAVQNLLSATELAERPLRPCFYSNRVLRVVSYVQSCGRSTGMQRS